MCMGETKRHVFFCIILLVKAPILAHGPSTKRGATTHNTGHLRKFNDAAHRGPQWYDYFNPTNSESDSEKLKSDSDINSQSKSSSDSEHGFSDSSDASSRETKERKMSTKLYRTCYPCPEDMMKKYKNIGIKWICGGYQRARRSFKSECMMRFRNCQDGTLFVKVYDHRCKNDTQHGRHWFYIYKV